MITHSYDSSLRHYDCMSVMLSLFGKEKQEYMDYNSSHVSDNVSPVKGRFL